ncbi:Lrp/AsnC family transcriptional regulator [Xanthomonas translucens pv. translucens]|nr:Lrp/AsnC family transcriptional regulator [Xanthomonas translucens]MCS3360003.1 Lrp/AsnC family transcriptional regulator [Xanthomonas translucens pv. translucens]MCS3373738.1 Lrp/AsnC family transcriptional regulator [Xanthomonas translucens pv. translucens]MCT8289493.1 Lrp/AsnC family transcriptional regulator [Xanthomonas translucens pv. translucens]MCT8293222.1 Lrp/AsnC family transcriptional regulator [Xanthomonas translucens pv. translucens]MCT8313281.1 Lrp/AsnC family transcriptional
MAIHRRRRRFADESKVHDERTSSVAAKPWQGDARDHAILETLQCDGRIALAELGRRIGLSQPAMSERVRRLEEQGVITGYAARVDPRAVGLATAAIVRLRTTHAQIGACLAQFAQMPQVLEVHRVTGEDCFVLRVLVPAPAQLEPIIDALALFGAVTTSVVLRSEAPRPIGRALLALAGQ